MNYSIAYHPLISRDLANIDDFLTADSGPLVADAKAVLTVRGIRSLSTLPYFGSRRVTPGGKEYRIKVAGKAVIAFTIDDENREVFIVAITYGGMDWQSRVVSRLD